MTAELLSAIALAVFGLGAIVLGAATYRNAASVVESAVRQLREMFESTMPQLFASTPDARAARLAGIGFVVAGVGLLVAAGLVLVAV